MARKKTKKLFLVSLGCPKNLVDSEVMLALLAKAGFTVCGTAEEADLLLVNTCGFIQSAVEEGIDEILALAEVKKNDPGKKLAVCGCLVQRYGNRLQKEIPEVDFFIGTEGFPEIVSIIESSENSLEDRRIFPESRFIMDVTTPRIVSTPPHRAYLKISEGCANKCSFCLIPSIRGKLRSRESFDLIQEAANLSGSGVKELTIIGQDITSYGLDLGTGAPSLAGLLEGLLNGCDIPWIRLLYLYPARLDDALLEVISANPRIVPYLDIPLQHVSSTMLKAMNRPHQRDKINLVIEKIRQMIDPVAIRSTFMVGFPGEREEDIRELEDFLKWAKLEHVGFFKYSNEEGCAAENFKSQCSEEEKDERYDRLMKLQAEICREKNKKFIGKKEKVLVEGLSSETDLLVEGRTRFQAAEIDGCVYINEGECEPGEFVNVEITEAHIYDLVGRVVD